MALYLSLSLLAVLLATPTSGSGEDPIGPVFLTAVGLLVAHLLAFSISSRLVSRGLFEPEARKVAAGQVLGGLAVVAIAMIPLLVFDAPTSIQVSEALLLALVVCVGYQAARQADVSTMRSVVYVGSVLVTVGLVLFLKSLVGH
jgi:hypothetical protein